MQAGLGGAKPQAHSPTALPALPSQVLGMSVLCLFWACFRDGWRRPGVPRQVQTARQLEHQEDHREGLDRAGGSCCDEAARPSCSKAALGRRALPDACSCGCTCSCCGLTAAALQDAVQAEAWRGAAACKQGGTCRCPGCHVLRAQELGPTALSLAYHTDSGSGSGSLRPAQGACPASVRIAAVDIAAPAASIVAASSSLTPPPVLLQQRQQQGHLVLAAADGACGEAPLTAEQLQVIAALRDFVAARGGGKTLSAASRTLPPAGVGMYVGDQLLQQQGALAGTAVAAGAAAGGLVFTPRRPRFCSSVCRSVVRLRIEGADPDMLPANWRPLVFQHFEARWGRGGCGGGAAGVASCRAQDWDQARWTVAVCNGARRACCAVARRIACAGLVSTAGAVPLGPGPYAVWMSLPTWPLSCLYVTTGTHSLPYVLCRTQRSLPSGCVVESVAVRRGSIYLTVSIAHLRDGQQQQHQQHQQLEEGDHRQLQEQELPVQGHLPAIEAVEEQQADPRRGAPEAEAAGVYMPEQEEKQESVQLLDRDLPDSDGGLEGRGEAAPTDGDAHGLRFEGRRAHGGLGAGGDNGAGSAAAERLLLLEDVDGAAEEGARVAVGVVRGRAAVPLDIRRVMLGGAAAGTSTASSSLSRSLGTMERVAASEIGLARGNLASGGGGGGGGGIGGEPSARSLAVAAGAIAWRPPSQHDMAAAGEASGSMPRVRDSSSPPLQNVLSPVGPAEHDGRAPSGATATAVSAAAAAAQQLLLHSPPGATRPRIASVWRPERPSGRPPQPGSASPKGGSYGYTGLYGYARAYSAGSGRNTSSSQLPALYGLAPTSTASASTAAAAPASPSVPMDRASPFDPSHPSYCAASTTTTSVRIQTSGGASPASTTAVAVQPDAPSPPLSHSPVPMRYPAVTVPASPYSNPRYGRYSATGADAPMPFAFPTTTTVTTTSAFTRASSTSTTVSRRFHNRTSAPAAVTAPAAPSSAASSHATGGAAATHNTAAGPVSASSLRITQLLDVLQLAGHNAAVRQARQGCTLNVMSAVSRLDGAIPQHLRQVLDTGSWDAEDASWSSWDHESCYERPSPPPAPAGAHVGPPDAPSPPPQQQQQLRTGGGGVLGRGGAQGQGQARGHMGAAPHLQLIEQATASRRLPVEGTVQSVQGLWVQQQRQQQQQLLVQQQGGSGGVSPSPSVVRSQASATLHAQRQVQYGPQPQLAVQQQQQRRQAPASPPRPLHSPRLLPLVADPAALPVQRVSVQPALVCKAPLLCPDLAGPLAGSCAQPPSQPAHPVQPAPAPPAAVPTTSPRAPLSDDLRPTASLPAANTDTNTTAHNRDASTRPPAAGTPPAASTGPQPAPAPVPTPCALHLSLICSPATVSQLSVMLRYSGPASVFGEQTYLPVQLQLDSASPAVAAAIRLQAAAAGGGDPADATSESDTRAARDVLPVSADPLPARATVRANLHELDCPGVLYVELWHGPQLCACLPVLLLPESAAGWAHEVCALWHQQGGGAGVGGAGQQQGAPMDPAHVAAVHQVVEDLGGWLTYAAHRQRMAAAAAALAAAAVPPSRSSLEVDEDVALLLTTASGSLTAAAAASRTASATAAAATANRRVAQQLLTTDTSTTSALLLSYEEPLLAPCPVPCAAAPHSCAPAAAAAAGPADVMLCDTAESVVSYNGFCNRSLFHDMMLQEGYNWLADCVEAGCCGLAGALMDSLRAVGCAAAEVVRTCRSADGLPLLHAAAVSNNPAMVDLVWSWGAEAGVQMSWGQAAGAGAGSLESPAAANTGEEQQQHVPAGMESSTPAGSAAGAAAAEQYVGARPLAAPVPPTPIQQDGAAAGATAAAVGGGVAAAAATVAAQPSASLLRLLAACTPLHLAAAHPDGRLAQHILRAYSTAKELWGGSNSSSSNNSSSSSRGNSDGGAAGDDAVDQQPRVAAAAGVTPAQVAKRLAAEAADARLWAAMQRWLGPAAGPVAVLYGTARRGLQVAIARAAAWVRRAGGEVASTQTAARAAGGRGVGGTPGLLRSVAAAAAPLGVGVLRAGEWLVLSIHGLLLQAGTLHRVGRLAAEPREHHFVQ